jgi:hypothetical protein
LLDFQIGSSFRLGRCEKNKSTPQPNSQLVSGRISPVSTAVA